MNKLYVTAVIMSMCLLGSRVRASAQDTETVSVPFEFVTAGATLPAGQYKVSRLSPGAIHALAISGGRGGAFMLPETFDGGSVGAPHLSFERVGGKYFLSTIQTLSGVYTMPAFKEMVTLGKANSPGPSTSSASGSQ